MREARMPASTAPTHGGDRRVAGNRVVEIDAIEPVRRCAGIELARVTRALGALHAIRAAMRAMWINDAAREAGRVEPFGGAAPHAGVVRSIVLSPRSEHE
jgi:hypothetical protein